MWKISYILTVAILSSTSVTTSGDNYQLTVSPQGLFEVGIDINITCRLEVHPSGHINQLKSPRPLDWYKGSKIINSEQVYQTGNYFWTLKNPQFEDNDIYSCSIPDFGLLETANIHFGAPPGKPEKYTATSDNLEDIATSWIPDKGLNIPTLYKIEYRTEEINSKPGCPNITYTLCSGSNSRGKNSCLIKIGSKCTIIGYVIKLTASNALGNNFSEWVFNFDSTIPNAPENVTTRVKNREEGKKELWYVKWGLPSRWNPQKSHMLDCRILYQTHFVQNRVLFGRRNGSCTKNETIHSETIIELPPSTVTYIQISTKYKFYYNGEEDEGWGAWSTRREIETSEAPPSGQLDWDWGVARTTSSDSEKRKVRLYWKLMEVEKSNGIILGYKIMIKNHTTDSCWNVTINNASTMELWTELYKEEEYNISVVAFNSIGDSSLAWKAIVVLDNFNVEKVPSNQAALLPALIAVFGTSMLILLSFLVWRLHRSLKQADKISDIQINIEELFTLSNVRKSGGCEIFDSVIPELKPPSEDLQVETTNLSHTDHYTKLFIGQSQESEIAEKFINFKEEVVVWGEEDTKVPLPSDKSEEKDETGKRIIPQTNNYSQITHSYTQDVNATSPYRSSPIDNRQAGTCAHRPTSQPISGKNKTTHEAYLDKNEVNKRTTVKDQRMNAGGYVTSPEEVAPLLPNSTIDTNKISNLEYLPLKRVSMKYRGSGADSGVSIDSRDLDEVTTENNGLEKRAKEKKKISNSEYLPLKQVSKKYRGSGADSGVSVDSRDLDEVTTENNGLEKRAAKEKNKISNSEYLPLKQVSKKYRGSGADSGFSVDSKDLILDEIDKAPMPTSLKSSVGMLPDYI